ncbi:MAG: TIM barrel protein, partial [Bryobacteraceae bacterium]
MSTTRRQFLFSTAAAALAQTAQAASSRYQVGITTNTIGGWEKDPFLGFREAREVGYRNVESFISYFPEYYPDKPKELKKRLDDIGVGVVTFSNGGAPTEMHFEDPSKREKIIADHLRLVRYSKTFGCDHLKINTGPRRPEGTTAADLENMSATLNELGKRIRLEEGIKFGVHAHMWSQFENRREIDYVMDHTDPKTVAFVLDTGHITLAGIDPLELAAKLGHRIV